MNKAVLKILEKGTLKQKKALFLFDRKTDREMIRTKFLYWSKWFLPSYFREKTGEYVKDAPFHKRMDEENINVYVGRRPSFLNIASRDFAKTTRTKLFIAFVVANDEFHFRKYFKVLSKDGSNSKQSVTDIYNMLISPRVRELYPEIFQKTDAKREETMASFTTTTGVKVTSDSILPDQRGQIQDDSRPDFLWFDDIETRTTLMSAVITNRIWLNIDEAVTGLAKGGGTIYMANYVSERGNVHKLVKKIQNQLIVPIAERVNGKWIPNWDRFTPEDVDRIEKDVEDFEGDYLCKPSASKDVYFDRESVDKQVEAKPIDNIAGLKIFKKYDPSHRIGSGHDVGGGVGLDHSTSVFIDFDCYPAQVMATYKNNEIKPDAFAYEIARQCKRFGENYCAPERNYGSTLDILKGIYPNDKIHKTDRTGGKIVFQVPTEYGWDCVMPDSKILTSDLKWVKASEVKKGDKIIGSTEEATRDNRGIYRHRYLINQEIRDIKKFEAEIVKVKLSDGREIRVSNNHPFLIYNTSSGGAKWKKASELKVGFKIYTLPVWTQDVSFESGRLSGLLCADGFIQHSTRKTDGNPSGLNMMVSQSEGELSKEIYELWEKVGLKPNRKYIRHKSPDRKHHKTMTYTGVGSSLLVLEALGKLRPTRLLNKFIEKDLIQAVGTKNLPKISVVGVFPEKEKSIVVGIETSEHTLFVDGLLSHNTNVNTKPTMLTALNQAIENGLLLLNDPDLIAEVRGYALGDLMDREVDPRLTTRHFDLLMACAIAWQMNKYIKKPEKPDMFDEDPSLAMRMLGKDDRKNPAR